MLWPKSACIATADGALLWIRFGRSRAHASTNARAPRSARVHSRAACHCSRGATELTAQSGFFNGRAGFVYPLVQLATSPYGTSPYGPAATVAASTRQVDLLGLVIKQGPGLHFPRERNLRLSTNWATESAGVLAVLRSQRLTAETSEYVPLLGTERGRHAVTYA